MVSRLAGLFRRRRIAPECREVREGSSDFIDGELDDSVTDRFKSHLERCRPCNAFVNTLRATVNLLRTTPKHKAPDGFRRRITENLPADRGD